MREDETDLRYPTGRPGWLGRFQGWPCGRCGQAVDDDEPHPCPDPEPERYPPVMPGEVL